MTILNALGGARTAIGTFLHSGSTAGRVVKVGSLATLGGSALALVACGGRDPRTPASLGAELVSGGYDKNNDGDLNLEFEYYNDKPRSKTECYWTHDVNGDGWVGYEECESWEKRTESWNDRYDISALLREADKDRDGTATAQEIVDVVARYDRYTGKGDDRHRVQGGDGELDDGEQKDFERDWKPSGPVRVDR